MKKNLTWLNWLLWLTIVLAIGSNIALAAECPSDIQTVTSEDANVFIEILAHQVKPLTKCELEVEANAWVVLLQKKVAAISATEVAAIQQKMEIEEAEKTGGVDKASQETEKKISQDETQQKIVETVKSEIKKKGESAATPGEAKVVTADLKTALLEHVTELTAERTLLIDRFKVVLAELASKGGETVEYDTYIKAVSGLKVDVTDASATWTTISGWLMSAEGGFRWALNIIQFLVIVIVFYLLAIIAGKATKKAFSKTKNFSKLLRDFLVLTSRRLVLVIGLFVGLAALEVNLGPVLAVVGATGFVIAFALQNSLSNFASGILMLLYRPFDVNDLISVAGTTGKVESMNLLSTQLRTPDNQLVIVPNNSVWGDVIVNITGITERRVDLVFGIGYSDNIDKAQKILEEIVNGHELVLKDPEAVVKLHELADSSVNFVCRPWVRPDNYWDVYWDITREVKRRFDAEGVSIPFPQTDVHLFHENS
ncbi:MAG: mechanosensitive ion channel family protein [Desulfobulbaceae bacterium]|nr:mechanosensitive ion channel family protein [Desulfobulbaceae bacterium]